VSPARPPRRRTDGAEPGRKAVQDRDVHDPDGVRLQKVLATGGYGSRRACEEIIAAGRVEVDGVRVRELGLRVDPAKAVVHVDGLRVQLDTSLVTIALNKPLGVVSSMHDDEGRPDLAPFVADRSERLYHVGRLDADSEGLLLLTNDGELANRLMHPRYEVAKTYLATLDGRVPDGLRRTVLRGVELEDGPVKADHYRVVDRTPQQSLVEIQLHEGRNRIVRRLFEQLGFPVTRLLRTQIGPVHLGTLKPGRTRVLGRDELGSLMAEVGL
jgi:23S rRNA pseudouridine2605 synthase